MQDFNATAGCISSDIELFLEAHRISFVQRDGKIYAQGNINISNKGLTGLPDLSSVVLFGHFDCHSNALTSLKGSPAGVTGQFNCSDNRLSSLEGAPAAVGGVFNCTDNSLKVYEHAPRFFGLMLSDHGECGSWAEVPEELRQSAETRARLAQQAEEEAVRRTTTSSGAIQVYKPIKFGK